MAWWANDQGVREDEEEGVKPGDYATVAGCVQSYTADKRQCPRPPY